MGTDTNKYIKIILPILTLLFSCNAMSNELKGDSQKLSITQKQELSRIMRRTGLGIDDSRLLAIVPPDIYRVLNQKKISEAEGFIPKEESIYNFTINRLPLKISGHNLVGARFAHRNANVAECVENSCEVDELYLKSIQEAKPSEDRYFVNYCVKNCLYGYADVVFDQVTANSPCQMIASISSSKNKRVFRLNSANGIFYIEAPRSSKSGADRHTLKSTSRITYISSLKENERPSLHLGASFTLPSNLLFTLHNEGHNLDPILICENFEQYFQKSTHNMVKLKEFIRRDDIH